MMENRLPVSPAQLRAFTAYLHALDDGEGQKRAAADCGISVQTLRNHTEEMYRRLGVTNAIQAALQLGMIRWDAGFPPWGSVGNVLVSHEDPVAGVPSDAEALA